MNGLRPCHDLLEELCLLLDLDVEEARARAEEPAFSKLSPDRFLREAGLADDAAVARALARVFGLEFLEPSHRNLDPQVTNMLPSEVARNFEVMPLKIDDGALVLGMVDPLDVMAEDVVRVHTGYPVRRAVLPRKRLLGLLGEKDTDEVEPPPDRPSHQAEVEIVEDFDEAFSDGEDFDPEDAPVVQMVNALLVDAVAMEASDIHVEPQAEGLRIRYRVDGVLRVISKVPRKLQGALISRLKVISMMDISERRRPQDGRTRVRVGGRPVDLRVSCLPCTYGEKMVLRILDRNAERIEIDSLGMGTSDLERYRRMFSRSQGLILITGPTGSGKTSTLYGTLHELNSTHRNIVTVEDPVELYLPGITQVQVNVRAGVTFASALRCILRQDPNVIMVGEIRDGETAEIAFQSAQTGHMVLSTVHTNSAAATLVRLSQIGIPGYLVGDCLLGVVAQRLVRRLCGRCRREAEPDTRNLAYLARAGLTSLPDRTWTADGCEDCGGTGFRGRTGLFEVVAVTPALKEGILAGRPEQELARLARDDGSRSLLEDGLSRVQAGETSLEELLRIVAVDPVAEERACLGICDFARRFPRVARSRLQ